MMRFLFLVLVVLAVGLLAGCGGTADTGKQKPADQTKPGDQPPKKDGDGKHKSSHEPG